MIYAKRILLQAEEFRRAGIVLEGDGKSPDHMKDQHLFLPMNLCFSFALEMYLKFLIVATRKLEPPKIHDTRKLFAKLPKNVYDLIKEDWESPDEFTLNARIVISDMTDKPYPTFEEQISITSDSFNRLRYWYQHQTPTSAITFSGGELLVSTRRVIFKIFPTEHADVRLPLPKGGLTVAEQNQLKWELINHPLKQPDS